MWKIKQDQFFETTSEMAVAAAAAADIVVVVAAMVVVAAVATFYCKLRILKLCFQFFISYRLR